MSLRPEKGPHDRPSRARRTVRLPSLPLTFAVIAVALLLSERPSRLLTNNPWEVPSAPETKLAKSNQGRKQERATSRDTPITWSSPRGLREVAIDLEGIARRSKVQSLSVREVRSSEFRAYRGNESPVSPASTIKLVVAELVVREIKTGAMGLEDLLPLATKQILPEGNKEGTQYSVRQALTLMLRDSDNEATNVLVKALGGTGPAFDAKARAAGYSDTRFVDYLSITDRVSSNNRSTLQDLSTAMARIFLDESECGEVMQEALRASSHNFGYSNVIAHKWGENSRVSGDVGLVRIRDRDHIVGAFAESEVLNTKTQRREAVRVAIQAVIDQLMN